MPIPYRTEERYQQPFSFTPLMMPQMDHTEITPTDLRVLNTKNCPCPQEIEEPQNLAYHQREDSDSDAEIDLTSHSKDDELRESERLANRIATSMFRTDAVLHDLVPNDLSLVRNSERRNNLSM